MVFIFISKVAVKLPKPKLVHECASRLTQRQLDTLIRKYPCLEAFDAVLPTSDQRADTPPSGKVDCYQSYITHGHLRIPATSFLMRILEFYGIVFARLNPTAVLKIVLFQMILSGLGFKRTVDTFRRVFRVVKCGCWYSIEARSDFKLMRCIPSAVKDWKFEYFFVDASFIHEKRRRCLVSWGVEKIDPELNKVPRIYRLTVEKLKDVNVAYRDFDEGVLVRVGISKLWHQDFVPVIMCSLTNKPMSLMRYLASDPDFEVDVVSVPTEEGLKMYREAGDTVVDISLPDDVEGETGHNRGEGEDG